MPLIAAEQATVRKRIVGQLKTLGVYRGHADKPTVNAAIDAIITRLESSIPTLNADIETAAPLVFNATEKTLIFGFAAQEFARKQLGL